MGKGYNMFALIQRTGFNEYNMATFPKDTKLPITDYDEMDNLPYILNADLICVMQEDSVDIVHFTLKKNLDYIKSNGIKPRANCIYDLGIGIYCIDKENRNGWDNLADSYSDFNEETEIIKVQLKYNGKYRECIWGEKHWGYLCLITDGLEVTDTDYEETIVGKEFSKYNR